MLGSYHDAEDVVQETPAGYVLVVFAYVLPPSRLVALLQTRR